MRAILPFGQGIWPAFWLLGANIGQVGWPACGETDIMEFVGRTPDDVQARSMVQAIRGERVYRRPAAGG